MADDPTAVDLDAKLRLAHADPAQVLSFYRALLGATVFVIGDSHDADRFALRRFEAEGKTVWPAFTSRERCVGYLTSGDCFAIDVQSMLGGLPEGSHVLINPDDPENGYALNDLLVEALRTGQMFQVDEKSFNGSFYTGPLRQPKAQLKKLLREVLAHRENVDAGFLTVMFEPASAYPPTPAVGIAGAGAVGALNDCRAAIDNTTRERVVLYPIGGDSLSQYAVRHSTPFYWRNPPVQRLPDALAPEELADFLRKLPEEPAMTNSLLKLYLRSGQSEKEAAALWHAMEPGERRRFGDLDAYTAWYAKAKQEETDNYRAASTHAEARRALLRAFDGDRRFCLYLHDFGGEAIQTLEDTASPEVKRVRWLSLPPRSVDEPLRTFLRSLPFPAAGVSNPREAVRLWPVVPFLELEDEDWLRVIVSLIATATLIVMSLEKPGPGLMRELFAVQRAGREDETLILIPDAEAERDRRKLLEMLGQGIAGPARSEPMESELLGRLSTFGKVSTWAEFADAYKEADHNTADA